MHVAFCEYLVFHEFRRNLYITPAKYLEQEGLASSFSSSLYTVFSSIEAFSIHISSIEAFSIHGLLKYWSILSIHGLLKYWSNLKERALLTVRCYYPWLPRQATWRCVRRPFTLQRSAKAMAASCTSRCTSLVSTIASQTEAHQRGEAFANSGKQVWQTTATDYTVWLGLWGWWLPDELYVLVGICLSVFPP